MNPEAIEFLESESGYAWHKWVSLETPSEYSVSFAGEMFALKDDNCNNEDDCRCFPEADAPDFQHEPLTEAQLDEYVRSGRIAHSTRQKMYWDTIWTESTAFMEAIDNGR